MGRAKSFDKFNVNEGKLSFLSKKEGTEIVNPFYDVTGRTQTNAQTTYGDDYTNSELYSVVMAFTTLSGQSRNLIEVFLKWKDSGPDGKTLDDFIKSEKRHVKPAIADLRKCLDEIEKYM